MAKNYGAIRSVTAFSPDDDYYLLESEYKYNLETRKYFTDPKKTYMSPSGAYVLVDKQHNLKPEEMEVAIAFADRGIIVELTNERDLSHAKIVYNNKPKFCEGVLAVERLSYEQRTQKPEKTELKKSVCKRRWNTQ